MLHPPTKLTTQDIAAALAAEWGVHPTSVRYRTVGLGSHHWEVLAADGSRWFLTADELDRGDVSLSSLRGALTTARELADAGSTYVLAPERGRSGDVLVQARGDFALSLHPFVNGESFSWGQWADVQHRREVLEMLVALHTAPLPLVRHLVVDDLSLPQRSELVAAVGAGGGALGSGPYAAQAARLLVARADTVARALHRFDALVTGHGKRSERWVPSHGEPHPGNTMRTGAGWVLIDWGTARWAPPERDLWLVDPGDGTLLHAYTEFTGVPVLPELLDLYSLWWTLCDIALQAARFRRRHPGDAQDAAGWGVLESGLAVLETWTSRSAR